MNAVSVADDAAKLRIVVMAAGDPHNPRTYSGIPSHLLAAMPDAVKLSGTVSCQPSKLAVNLIRLSSFAPTKRSWRSRWRLSMGQVRAASREAERGIHGLKNCAFDAFLQIGTYCSVAQLVSKPVFVYIDHSLPSLVGLDPRMKGTSMRAGYVRRRLADEKDVLNSCTRIFTLSEWCKRRVMEDYGIDAARIECVGAGSNIDESLLTAEPAYAAQHVVIVGFDFERKGGWHVLKAFERVRAELPRARLTIVGGLPEGTPAPGVTSTGRLIGPDSGQRIASIFAGASLYAMPSVFEPFGIAFLEAMAAGLPCIGANACAMPEIIGETGAIVQPGDTESLARAMLDFLSDPDMCRRRGSAARARYQEQYGWEKTARRMQHAIEAAI